MSVSKEVVKKMAYLSRIKMSDEEILQMGDDLNSIVSFVEQLNEIDCDGVECYKSAKKMPERADEVIEDEQNGKKTRVDVLKNAYEVCSNMYVVPRVVE